MILHAAMRMLALVALTGCLIAQPGVGWAADPKITPEAMRAAQIGLLPSFDNLPSADDLVLLLKNAETQTARNAPRGGFVIQFQGGTTVAHNSFENLAKIRFIDAQGREEFCSGVFLDEEVSRRVLTAGHCSCGRLDSYEIYRGDNTENHKRSPYVLAAPPDRYGGYSCELFPEQQIGRDLALLRVWPYNRQLERANVAFSENEEPSVPVKNAKMASIHQVYQDRATINLVGVGFGRTENTDEPKTAVAAIIPIASFFCTAGGFAASACAPFREFVLADLRAGRGRNLADSCGGDSGSPIYWVPPAPSPGTPPARYLVGITSRAVDGVRHNPATACGGGGVYTAVGHPDVVRWLGSFGILMRSDPPSTVRSLKK